jgi:hypothetical protein
MEDEGLGAAATPRRARGELPHPRLSCSPPTLRVCLAAASPRGAIVKVWLWGRNYSRKRLHVPIASIGPRRLHAGPLVTVSGLWTRYVGYNPVPLALTRQRDLAVHKQHLRAGLRFDTSVALRALRQIVTATECRSPLRRSLTLRTEATAESGSECRRRRCARGNELAGPLGDRIRSSAANRSPRTLPSARRSALRKSRRAPSAPS